jgi:hypothetical protein
VCLLKYGGLPSRLRFRAIAFGAEIWVSIVSALLASF